MATMVFLFFAFGKGDLKIFFIFNKNFYGKTGVASAGFSDLVCR